MLHFDRSSTLCENAQLGIKCEVAVRVMKETGGRSIINMASIAIGAGQIRGGGLLRGQGRGRGADAGGCGAQRAGRLQHPLQCVHPASILTPMVIEVARQSGVTVAPEAGRQARWRSCGAR